MEGSDEGVGVLLRGGDIDGSSVVSGEDDSVARGEDENKAVPVTEPVNSGDGVELIVRVYLDEGVGESEGTGGTSLRTLLL